MRETGRNRQFARAFPRAFRSFAPHEPAMIQQESKYVQIPSASECSDKLCRNLLNLLYVFADPSGREIF